jgi:phosphatidylglycerol---prolipoprotein diacylglyceryl transferase
LVGSRTRGILEQAPSAGLQWQSLLAPGGKTIVGGLLGGWLAVELAKLTAGLKSRTGDLFEFGGNITPDCPADRSSAIALSSAF